MHVDNTGQALGCSTWWELAAFSARRTATALKKTVCVSRPALAAIIMLALRPSASKRGAQRLGVTSVGRGPCTPHADAPQLTCVARQNSEALIDLLE
jgi:hypothetical protein